MRLTVFLMLAFGCSHEVPCQISSIGCSMGYRLYEEFSFDQSIQKTTNPSFTDIGSRARKYDRKWGAPFSFVPNVLVRWNEDSAGLRIGLSYYRVGLSGAQIGSTIRRDHFNLHINFEKLLYKSARQRTHVYSVFGTMARYGTDTYWRPGWGFAPLPTRRLKDLGFVLGLSASYNFTKWFLIGVELSYVRWVFLYSNYIQHLYHGASSLNRKPFNQLDITFRVSLVLGKS